MVRPAAVEPWTGGPSVETAAKPSPDIRLTAGSRARGIPERVPFAESQGPAVGRVYRGELCLRKPNERHTTNADLKVTACTLLAAAMGGGGIGRAIESPERAGQASLVNSDTLPTRFSGREALEAAGVKFGAEVAGDSMFTYVERCLRAGRSSAPIMPCGLIWRRRQGTQARHHFLQGCVL